MHSAETELGKHGTGRLSTRVLSGSSIVSLLQISISRDARNTGEHGHQISRRGYFSVYVQAEIAPPQVRFE